MTVEKLKRQFLNYPDFEVASAGLCLGNARLERTGSKRYIFRPI
jgi:hypothetical protein